MGQKSIPNINKTGFSMFWDNMWDDKLNYSKNLHKSMLLKEVINIFFKNPNALNFFKNNYFFFFNKFNKFKYNIFFFNKFNKQNFKKFKKKKELNIYLSKIWLLKIDNWFIIFLFSIFEKKKTF